MTEERQEKNRRLAEWLGFHYYGRDVAGDWWTKPEDKFNAEAAFRFDPYTSEDASALLLDKLFKDTRFSMRFMKLYETDPGQWEVRDFDWAKRDADRKTAIAESALRVHRITRSTGEEIDGLERASRNE